MKYFLLILLLSVWGIEVSAWTDTLTAGTPIKVVHLAELRQAVNDKRASCGMPTQTWTDTTLIPGKTNVKAVHLNELRQAVVDLVVNGLKTPWTGGWSNDPLAKGIAIKAIHFKELRNEIDKIYCPAWETGPWSGVCSGGSGTWSYSSWNTCSGGTTAYSYGAWGTCSVKCGGGTQSRSSVCKYNAMSGTQSRTATCNFSSDSGTQTRTVECKANGVTLPDSSCVTAKPATTQSCTPSDTSVCGTQSAVTQSCTQVSPAPTCSGAPVTSQACNTQNCCATVSYFELDKGNNCGYVTRYISNGDAASLKAVCQARGYDYATGTYTAFTNAEWCGYCNARTITWNGSAWVYGSCKSSTARNMVCCKNP